jgi:hypothetical protein
VNQWRNIAQHLSATVETDDIVCRYGANNQHIARLRREDLEAVLAESMIFFRALRLARQLFFFDHLEELHASDLLLVLSSMKQRPEATFMVLLAGIASQGFSVVETSLTPEWSTLVVQDVSTLPAEERRIHASQFVIPLADFRPAPMLSVEYRELDGTPSLLVIIPFEVIERSKSTDDDGSLVANEATFVDLKKATPEELAQIRKAGVKRCNSPPDSGLQQT